MKKLLLFCLVVLLAGFPVSTVSAAETIQIMGGDTDLIIESDAYVPSFEHANEKFTVSPDGNSMEYTITLKEEGEKLPVASFVVTRTTNGVTYKGTVYLTTYRYLNGWTTATYEGILYLVETA